MKKTILFSFFCLLLYGKLSALTYTVTSTGDGTGSGTLRWAITQANGNAGADIINFNLGSAGPYTITIASNLPTITEQVTINGYSNTNAVQGPLGAGTRVMKVVLNGPGNSTVNGLTITASNCVISGLVIQDFFKGIYIDGGDNNWIWGCYIGTAFNGLSQTIATTCYDDGIDLENNANNNIIGTNGDASNDANEGNLIAGNGDGNVQFLGECITLNEIGMTTATNCSGNRIAGNYLGTNETGTAALYTNTTAGAQRGSGVQINFSSGNIIGTNGDGISDALERNIISGNGDNGILLWGATSNKIKGNYIGTTKTGLVGLPNYVDGGTNIAAVGITFRTNSDNNFIGTDGDGVNDNVEGNVIGSATIVAGSANSYNYGIVITSTSAGNRVSGNYVGIGADGVTALSFVTTGGSYIEKCIFVRNSSNNCIVGTNGDGISDALEANYVGNAGLGITFENVSGCVMAGNYLGLGTNLTTAETLTTAGAYILNSTTCRVGSSASVALERNYFCNSTQYGVWIDRSSTSVDNNNVNYNTFGLRPDGVAAPNAKSAVLITNNTQSNTIQNNIISKNGTASASGLYAAIEIGLAASSTSGAQSNTIYRNQIYKNVGPGINILVSTSTKNLISQNSIYNNGNASDATGKFKLGIDLNGNEVTTNDNQDPDTGPNDLSNLPVISGAAPSGAGCTEQLKGIFNGLPNTQYFIEIFSNDVCNGDTLGLNYYTTATRNYGEGRTYLGVSATFTTDGSGNGNWTYPVALASISGLYITATAIQASGTGLNNTSEFSLCYYVLYDCGDAPDSYRTLLSSCGPLHLNQSQNLKIGATIDPELNGVPSVNADGDGADEDGIGTLPPLTSLSTSYTITNIPVTNSSGTSATLFGWVDFNVNGSFEASEFTSVSVPSSGAQTVSLTWSSLTCGTNLLSGNSYIRLRLTSSTLVDAGGTATIDERSYGDADNGEVEDYFIYITGYDYGDLSASHPTAITASLQNTATTKVWAGVTPPSMECTQKFSADAQGDGAEEDGLTTGIGPWGSSYNWVIRLSTNQPGKTVYYGLWLDWNGNGNFVDAADAFYSGSAAVTGTTNVNVSVYSSYAMTYASAFRLIVSDAPITSAMFNATFANGEVEDYLVMTLLVAPGNILTGKKEASENLLKWKNTSGIAISNYVIERSINNLSWTSLGAVTPSTSNTQNEYSFSDFKPQVENYYRLKMYLADGSYLYSNILPLFDNSNDAPVILFPNPAINKLTIQISNSDFISLKIFDLTGRLHITQQIKSAISEVDISNIAAGTHVIKFIQKNGSEQVQRFVKIK